MAFRSFLSKAHVVAGRSGAIKATSFGKVSSTTGVAACSFGTTRIAALSAKNGQKTTTTSVFAERASSPFAGLSSSSSSSVPSSLGGSSGRSSRGASTSAFSASSSVFQMRFGPVFATDLLYFVLDADDDG
eukprot:TRINITY_DN15549_c0_g1_i1.p1 TRINITY_DN15549_c0_g1~~TRINITY_DN15549_c0_g1_i1.p1  ORF type:complete len:140 (-),score=40.00 TRINITY_DN15549_c0_g1_i1:33-425(-)